MSTPRHLAMDLLLAGIEKSRRLLEERDAVQLAAAMEHHKLHKIKSVKERLKVELFVRNAIRHVLSLSAQLQHHLDSQKDRLHQERQQLDSSSDLSMFYGLLKQVKEHHRRSPNEPADGDSLDQVIQGLKVTDEQLEAMFSGEEALGRFLDLNALFVEFLNLCSKKDRPAELDYLNYVKSFDAFSTVADRQSPAYVKYLEELGAYLESFCNRALPLSALPQKHQPTARDTPAFQAELARINDLPFDPSLFCRNCDRLFHNPNSFESHLRGKQHAKKVHLSVDKTVDELREQHDAMKAAKQQKLLQTMQLEAKVQQLAALLSAHRAATAANIERKQAMTAEELAEEQSRAQIKEMAEQQQASDDRSFLEKDMDGGVYNPLKLPLDWDGKPIPLWLWKLHGLGTKYPCEVCGNYVYLGRKAFDQHFHEWRHSHGMRCLGVPNTRHFFQITSIQEVLSLWEAMKRSPGQPQSVEEEVEDRQGNVYTKRMYEDMRRQGLI